MVEEKFVYQGVLDSQQFHVAEIATTPVRSESGLLIAKEQPSTNPILDATLKLYEKEYYIPGEFETRDIILDRLNGSDAHSPEMKIMALLDDKQQVRGVSFFERYTNDGKAIWLNTYAIVDDQLKENYQVASAFHHGCADRIHDVDLAAKRPASLIVAEVNSTRDYQGHTLEENKKFADAEWMIKSGEPAEVRESYQVGAEARAIKIGQHNRVLFQADYIPPDLEELSAEHKGASADEVAGLLSNKHILRAKSGENTGAEPLFGIAFNSDSSELSSHDMKQAGELLRTKLPRSVLLGNSDGILDEAVVEQVLSDPKLREQAGLGKMDKDFAQIVADRKKEEGVPNGLILNVAGTEQKVDRGQGIN